jgi:hypothetical protein
MSLVLLALQFATIAAQPSDLVCGLSGEHAFVASDAYALLHGQKLSVYVFEIGGCLTNATVASRQCGGLVIMELPANLVRGVDGGSAAGGVLNLTGGETPTIVRGGDLWDHRCERRNTVTASSGTVSVGSVTSDGFELVWSLTLSNGETSRGRVPIRWGRTQ